MEYRRMIAQWMQSAYQQACSAYKSEEESPPWPSTMSRDFTFSVYLPHARFADKRMEIPEKTVYVLFSCYDALWGERFRQMFDRQLHQDEPFVWREDGMLLQQMRTFAQPLRMAEQIRIRFRSPLLVRDQHGGAGERYLCAQDADFQSVLTRIVQAQVQQAQLPLAWMKHFQITQSQGLRRLRVLHQGKKLRASLGTCVLLGDTRLLGYLYGAGIGSRRSTGFGLFDMEKQRDGNRCDE